MLVIYWERAIFSAIWIVSREKSLKLRLVCAVLFTLYVLEICTTRNVQDCTEI